MIWEIRIIVFVMKNITMDEANRAQALFDDIQDNIQELTTLLKSKMSRTERTQFRYHCLGYLEPGLKIDHNWIVSSNIQSLEKWIVDAVNEATDSESVKW